MKPLRTQNTRKTSADGSADPLGVRRHDCTAYARSMNENDQPNTPASGVVDCTDDDPCDQSVDNKAPPAKKARLTYQEPATSTTNSGGRPKGNLWAFFTQSAQKQNSVHYSAYCQNCTSAGQRHEGTVTGSAPSMKAHLTSCKHQPKAVKLWAKDWTKDSEPFVAASDDCDVHHATSSGQASMGSFLSFKDKPMTEAEQLEFDLLLVNATVSANLPFAWIDNEHVRKAFEFARPEIHLPDRKKLAGKCSSCWLLLSCHTYMFCFVIF